MKKNYDKYYEDGYYSYEKQKACNSSCNSNNSCQSSRNRNYDLWVSSNDCKVNDSCKSSKDNCKVSAECACQSNNCLQDSSCNEICDSYKLYNFKFGKEIIKTFNPNIAEFTCAPNDCEVRIDLNIAKTDSAVIWGEVRDKCETPVENVLVTLLKPVYIRGCIEYIKECTTLTNCIGYYQFHIDYCDKDTNYKVVLGKKCS